MTKARVSSSAELTDAQIRQFQLDSASISAFAEFVTERDMQRMAAAVGEVLAAVFASCGVDDESVAACVQGVVDRTKQLREAWPAQQERPPGVKVN